MRPAAGSSNPPTGRGNATDSSVLTEEEQIASENYIAYRMRLAPHPLAGGERRGGLVSHSMRLLELSDRVILAELELLSVRTADLDDDIRGALIEQEALRLKLGRLRQTLAVGLLKLSDTQSLERKLESLLDDAGRRRLATPPQHHSVMKRSLESTFRGARLHDAIAAASDVCPTVVYPAIAQYASTIAQARRKTEIEHMASEALERRVTVVREDIAALQQRLREAEVATVDARSRLDEAHRGGFTLRKRYILTHKRLISAAAGGGEKAGDQQLFGGGAYDRPLTASEAASAIARIQAELRQGVLTTLDQLSFAEVPVSVSRDTNRLLTSSQRGSALRSDLDPGGAGRSDKSTTHAVGHDADHRSASLLQTPGLRLSTRFAV